MGKMLSLNDIGAILVFSNLVFLIVGLWIGTFVTTAAMKLEKE